MPEVELYPFQRDDVDKLIGCASSLNASEMGTGKTYTLATICQERSPGLPKLWVGPLQTLESSAEKIRQLGFDEPITFINPKNRDDSFKAYKKRGGYFFCHWEALRLMPDIKDHEWAEVVADEVHRAQNRKAQQTRALKMIKTSGKLGASGTPVTGAADKYWSVLNWLKPSEWTSYWKYYKRYVDYEIIYPQGYHKYRGPLNADELVGKVAPYSTRHLKKEQCCPHHPQGVMPWLPDKYYTPVEVDLTPKQRRAYEDMRKEMIAWVGAHEHEPLVAPVVIAQMIRLQQFACAYASMVDDKVILTEPSSKADAVMQIIEDNPDEPIVVYSQFNRMLDVIAARLDTHKIEYSTYTGRNRSTREKDKKAFIRGETSVFLGNIAAGGVGLDELQHRASAMIFTDRLWSPALNNQAEDRLWRDGQKNAVQIIDIIARNTVDRGRHQRLEETWAWIKKLLGDKP